MKKTLFLLFALCTSLFLQAQNSGNYRDSINLIFSELNQAEITMGILLDRASPDIDLSNYSIENDSAASFSSWKFI